jgi:integrase/recombinase XerD
MKHLPLKSQYYQDLQKKYSLYLERVGYNQNTCKMLPSMTREFFYFLEGISIKNLREVTAREITEYYHYLKTRPSSRGPGTLSQSMQHMHLWGLRILFSFLLAEGSIQADPFSTLSFPAPQKKEREVLSRKEIEQLYNACESFKDKALLGLFYGCGLRKSEVEALNVKDISFRGKLVYVRSGKGKRRRVVPMPERVITDLKQYYYQERVHVLHKQRATAQETQPAFLLNVNGSRMMGQSLWRRLRILVLKAEIDHPERVTLHNLRHSIATHLLDSGVGIEQVRDFLGHTHLESTQVYTRVGRKHLDRKL